MARRFTCPVSTHLAGSIVAPRVSKGTRQVRRDSYRLLRIPGGSGGQGTVTAPHRPTKMVPSDPANSPFSDWHAQSEHSTQCSRDAVLLLPVAAFIRPRISAPEPICLFYLLEARVSKQTFARPHRLLPFESHRSEVNAPALSLRRNSELFFQSVRP